MLLFRREFWRKVAAAVFDRSATCRTIPARRRRARTSFGFPPAAEVLEPRLLLTAQLHFEGALGGLSNFGVGDFVDSSGCIWGGVMSGQLELAVEDSTVFLAGEMHFNYLSIGDPLRIPPCPFRNRPFGVQFFSTASDLDSSDSGVSFARVPIRVGSDVVGSRDAWIDFSGSIGEDGLRGEMKVDLSEVFSDLVPSHTARFEVWLGQRRPARDIEVLNARLANSTTLELSVKTTSVTEPFDFALFRSHDGQLDPEDQGVFGEQLMKLNPFSVDGDGVHSISIELGTPIFSPDSPPVLLIVADPPSGTWPFDRPFGKLVEGSEKNNIKALTHIELLDATTGDNRRIAIKYRVPSEISASPFDVHVYLSSSSQLAQGQKPILSRRIDNSKQLAPGPDEKTIEVDLGTRRVGDEDRFLIVKLGGKGEDSTPDGNNNTAFVVPLVPNGSKINRLGEIHANFPERNENASGPPVGPIHWGTPDFLRLEGLYQTWTGDVFGFSFKETEPWQQLEDTLAQPAVVEAVGNLVQLINIDREKVPDFWRGFKFSINEAYDSLNEHGSTSLHYEGRAVDLDVGTNKDIAQLRRLAGLAWLAGFDWVFFEGTHVHASKRDSLQRTNEPAVPPFSIQYRLRSPANLLVIDADGRRSGFDPDTGQTVLEIPGTLYSGPDSEPETLTVPFAADGTYTVHVVGTDTGSYTLDVIGTDVDANLGFQSFTGQIESGTAISYAVDYSAASAAALSVRAAEHRPGSFGVTGADAGGGPHVRVFDTVTGQERFGFFAFDRGFKGGVRVATGDVNGDGVPDIIAGAGPGGGPAVRVFDGASGEMISQFFAFDRGFRGGIHVATGDMDGDGTLEIIVGAGAGGGPAVRVFNPITGDQIGETIFAFDRAFRGGVNVATGDVDGDGIDEIIVAAGPTGGPAVRVFNGVTGAQIGETIFAFDRAFRGGVYVAAGDLDGNGAAEIIVGAGEGGGPAVRVFDGVTGAQIGDTTFAFPPGFRGGVRVATGDLNLDGRADIYAAAGPAGATHVAAFRGLDRAPLGSFFVYPGFGGGVFIAGNSPGGSALRAVNQPSSPSEKAEPLTERQLAPILKAAITRLEAAGLSESLLARLANVQFFVTDLWGDLLAVARPGRILLDDDAAGFGWFVDYSPLLDEEFFNDGSQFVALDSRAAGRIDLLTVVLHELGHALGLDHNHSPAGQDALMSSMPSGVRRLPDPEELDALFATAEWLDLAAV